MVKLRRLSLLERAAWSGCSTCWYKANNHDWTPIVVAAQNDHVAVVQYLVQHGADKDKANIAGKTPLHVAALNGHMEMVQYLVQQGADKDNAKTRAYPQLYAAADKGRQE